LCPLRQRVDGWVIHFPGRLRYQLAQHNYRPKASAPPTLAVWRGLPLAHLASQGALVTILWLWALSTEPPQRAVMMLALPPVRAVLPSVALTVLKLSNDQNLWMALGLVT